MASQKLSVFSISLKNGISWDTVLQNLLLRAAGDEHYIISEQSEDYIGGCYIVQIKQNQLLYNVNEQCFESVLVEKQYVLKYDIFAQDGSMMLWGNHKLSSRFITALTLASNNLAIIESKESDYKNVLFNLVDCRDVKFIRMKLHDVVIEDGIIANCSVALEGRENATQLIKKYIDKVVTVTLQIVNGDNVTAVMLYSSGAMVIFKDRENIPDQVIDRISSIVRRDA